MSGNDAYNVRPLPTPKQTFNQTLEAPLATAPPGTP